MVGQGSAIVHPTPGLTRDFLIESVEDYKIPFNIIDTGGITFDKQLIKQAQDEKGAFFIPEILRNTKEAIKRSHILIYVVDAKEGIKEEDKEILKYLRENVVDLSALKKEQFEEIKHLPVVQKSFDTIEKQLIVERMYLVVNKCDNGDTNKIENDVYNLGFEEPIFLSAECGDNMHAMWQIIEDQITPEDEEYFKQRGKKRVKKYKELKKQLKEEVKEELRKKDIQDYDIEQWSYEFDLMNPNPEDNSDFDSDSEIDPSKSYMSKTIVMDKTGVSKENYLLNRKAKVSIVGRPNAGKSSLVNAIVKENRCLVSDQAHTTTDSNSIQWVYNNRKYELVDTAGLERRIKYKSPMENLIYTKTMHSIKKSQVVIVMIDALDAFMTLDFDLIQTIFDEGKPVVIAVNKWDLVHQKWKHRAHTFMTEQVAKNLGILKGVPVHFVSAKEGGNITKMLDDVGRVYERWNTRISTGLINSWLRRFKRIQKMPNKDKKHLKILYVNQLKVRPPTFGIFVNDVNLASENYQRFLKSTISEEFGLQGVPIRLILRGTKYKDLKKSVARAYDDIEEGKGAMRNMYLSKRKMKGFAKIKLEELGENQKRKQSSS